LSCLQITINRPDRRNAFRPNTIKELIRAFNDARDDSTIGVIILTGKVGSFDAGYGSSIMSRLLERLELETLKWSREILRNSPTAIRVLKSALNAVDDGHAGLQLFS
ncbi:hypothetical protein BHM03_00018418, partial [Ensete ventricosum]